MPNMPSFYEPYDVVNCMPCAFFTMSEFFKSFHATSSISKDTSNISNKHEKAKTVVPPDVEKDTPISKSNDNFVKNNTEKETINVKVKHVKIESNVDPVATPKPSGPKHL